MWKNLKDLSVNLLKFNKYFFEQQRTKFILKRKHDIQLSKLTEPCPKKLKRIHYFYDLVEADHTTKQPDLDLVLLQDVPGIGIKGEKIKARFYAGYYDLLLPKLAVYADSPEAKNIIRKEADIKFSSIYSKTVSNFFAQQPLPVFMSFETEWTLQPWHIRVALRRIGILTYDECIKLPTKVISGPNPDIENKDFVVKVTMNNTEEFSVRCRIYHWSVIEVQNVKLSDTKIINSESEPLFKEDLTEVNKLLETQKEFKKSEELRKL